MTILLIAAGCVILFVGYAALGTGVMYRTTWLLLTMGGMTFLLGVVLAAGRSLWARHVRKH